MADENYVISLNNFAPEEFLGGAKRSKILECDRTMKAFSFVERNKISYNAGTEPTLISRNLCCFQYFKVKTLFLYLKPPSPYSRTLTWNF